MKSIDTLLKEQPSLDDNPLFNKKKRKKENKMSFFPCEKFRICGYHNNKHFNIIGSGNPRILYKKADFAILYGYVNGKWLRLSIKEDAIKADTQISPEVLTHECSMEELQLIRLEN